MIRSAATHQKRSRSGSGGRLPKARVEPQNSPLAEPVPQPGQLRLVRAGAGGAGQVWRLKMEASNEAARLPGVTGALKVFSAARAAFALVGIATVAALAHPVPREVLMRQAAGLAQYWDAQAGNVAEGTIQPGSETAAAREQRAVAEFIGKRYRVSQDAVAGFRSEERRVGKGGRS